MRRILILSLAAALTAAACGGGSEAAGDDSTTTSTTLPGDETETTTDTGAATTEAPAPLEWVLDDADNGRILNVEVGDAVSMRLPVEDAADPQWVIVKEPDPEILEIIDSLLWTPSEPGAEAVAFEFVFYVVGTGVTDVTFSLGPLTPTSRTIGFTVQSG